MQEIIKPLIQKNNTKIIFAVLDGLGGFPVDGKTELETAATPHMDALARISACGLHTPVGPGITPGSGPGHLALFGYDPVACQIGRGVLEALGLGIAQEFEDVAARGGFTGEGGAQAFEPTSALGGRAATVGFFGHRAGVGGSWWMQAV